MDVITIFLQSAFKHWKFLHLSACLMISHDFDNCCFAPAKCPVKFTMCTIGLNIKWAASGVVSCTFIQCWTWDWNGNGWKPASSGSLMRQTARFKEQLRWHFNASVWFDSSVGSNPFQPALTSIRKLPHTITTLRQHWERGGTDNMERCYLWSHWWNTQWTGRQVLVAVEKQ